MRYSNSPLQGEMIWTRRVLSSGYRALVLYGVQGGRGAFGVSVCSPKDRFDEERGLAVARGRARKAISEGHEVEAPTVTRAGLVTQANWEWWLKKQKLMM